MVKQLFLTLFALCVAAVDPARAEIALQDVNDCIVDQIEKQQQVGACVRVAHTECQSVDAATPAVATLCFVKLEQDWNAGIAGIMSNLSANAPEDIATIAAIEVKYDLLTALLMCDRMEELQLAVGQIAEEDLLLGVAQCKAQAAASSYVRLFARARDFN